jgi:transcriptional regulator with GAF, ATPase, and Fis domain
MAEPEPHAVATLQATFSNRDCALLFRDPQRRYTAFQPVVPAAEECLIVPFYVAGEAMGTVWAVMHTDRRRFDREDKRVMEALAQFASIAHQTGAGASVGKKSKPHSAEQDFRRIADSIPALVYTATPGGEGRVHKPANAGVFRLHAGRIERLGKAHPPG